MVFLSPDDEPDDALVTTTLYSFVFFWFSDVTTSLNSFAPDSSEIESDIVLFKRSIDFVSLPPDRTAVAFLFANSGVSLIAEMPLSTENSTLPSSSGVVLVSPGTSVSADKSALYSAVSTLSKFSIYITGSLLPS